MKFARLPGFHSLCVRIELGGGCGLCCVMPGPKGKECVAFGCTEYAQSSSYSFHVFPKDPKRRKEWALKVKRKGHDGKLWMPGQHDCLCSKHFEEEDFTTRTQLQRQGVLPSHIKFAAQLKPDAVPSLFSYNEKTKQKHQDSANKRASLAKKRSYREFMEVSVFQQTLTVAYYHNSPCVCVCVCVYVCCLCVHVFCLWVEKLERENGVEVLRNQECKIINFVTLCLCPVCM